MMFCMPSLYICVSCCSIVFFFIIIIMIMKALLRMAILAYRANNVVNDMQKLKVFFYI